MDGIEPDLRRPGGAATALARAFAQRVRAWSLALGAEEAAASAVEGAAEALSMALAAGDTGLPIAELPGAPSRALLLASRVVEAAEATGAMLAPDGAPLVLDTAGWLFTRRQHALEATLARRLVTLARRPGPPPPGLPLVLTGGPGAGKTTALVRLVADRLDAEPGLAVVLAAPTGKAAARMAEAFAERSGAIAATRPAATAAALAALPQQALTVHRLLGARPDGGFRHGEGRPVALDLLVLDEASMLDLALASRLAAALPAHADLLLVGDAEQLAAVEAGAVFASLTAAGGPLSARVQRLFGSHRFAADAGIGRLATALRAGDEASVAALFETAAAAPRAGAPTDFTWFDEPGEALPPRVREAAIEGFGALAAAARHAHADPAALPAALEALAAFRVLCATHEGPWGRQALNAALAQHFGGAGPAGAADAPFPGRPVIVRRNEPLLGVANGDVGLWWPAAAGEGGAGTGYDAVFPRRGSGDDRGGGDGGPGSESRLHRVPQARLPMHDTAYAMTVHQAQGSEFDTALVLLPAPPVRPPTREWLYTAATRAKRRLVVAGGAAAWRHAASHPTQRRTGLPARLREAAQATQP
jgi:exodeoxyribonuclease V alpha subunit